jgi:hypothetical protein
MAGAMSCRTGQKEPHHRVGSVSPNSTQPTMAEVTATPASPKRSASVGERDRETTAGLASGGSVARGIATRLSLAAVLTSR